MVAQKISHCQSERERSVSAAEIGAERAENRLERSGAVSGFKKPSGAWAERDIVGTERWPGPTGIPLQKLVNSPAQYQNFRPKLATTNERSEMSIPLILHGFRGLHSAGLQKDAITYKAY